MKKLIDRIAQIIVDQLIQRLGMDGLRIAIVNAQPGDLIIVNSEFEINERSYLHIQAQWESLFPHNRVVVTHGFHIDVIHAPQEEKQNAR